MFYTPLEASRGLVHEREVEIGCECVCDAHQNEEKETEFHDRALILFFFLVRGGVFVNGVPIFVLHRCGFEHLVAFGLLARGFVVARFAIDLGLVIVGSKTVGYDRLST